MKVNPSQEGLRRAVHWAGTHLRPGDLGTKNSGSMDDTDSKVRWWLSPNSVMMCIEWYQV